MICVYPADCRGFEIAVTEGHPCALMTAYNKINGTYCANSSGLCTDMLRGEWGFDGIVMTDWLSTGEDRADHSQLRGIDLLPYNYRIYSTFGPLCLSLIFSFII